ncbi:MAG: ABC transporter, permease protein 2 (cluster 11, riboflavin/purine nucleoside/unknown) [uncultured Thermomicrobiales bacterium]|uniref:Nucleoside ABC transporter, permease protein 2 n=1 Tax=uncultured Thermomicrobiales bacterium TaxID=1645740 RepID=A0A6J4USP8_9BACT|nr:MAG: ABC transporter, permease protein 2 (cluster 11, riboflavin/purine nucleoside/unknown) [uncultured Thermomicrobiales bacterium]
MNLLLSLLATTLTFATPITLGAMSGLACERAGVVNIAIEGMMLSAAFAGFWAAVTTGNLYIAIVAAIVVGVLMSALHAALAITCKVDQIISSTVINILGFGLTSYLYGQWYARNAPDTPGTLPSVPLPGTSVTIRVLALVAIAIVLALHFVLKNTAWGLRVRAVGEHPRAADTVGINVRRVRYSAVLVGGALAGLGGAHFVPGYVPSFSPGMTAGYGFIALAAMIFGKWRPLGAWAAALFFGFTLALQITLQTYNVPIDTRLIGALPYLATLIVLAGFVGRSTPPAADGVPY